MNDRKQKILYFKANDLTDEFLSKWIECMKNHIDTKFGKILSDAFPSSDYPESPGNDSTAENSSDDENLLKSQQEHVVSQEKVSRLYN